ncbi:MAG: transglycosylase domain-containing protein [Haliscomenobacter sp.]|nr:transglycosylase domain-containing protein [Haliscomenobacter sp.]
MSYNASLQVFLNKIKAAFSPLNERWKRFAARKPRLARWVRLSGLAFLGMVLALFVFRTTIALSVPSVRELREIQTQVATEVYSADSILLGRYFNQYRTVVQYQDIPPHVFQALVATEDSRFYQHRGVDYRAWGRVLFRTIISGDRSGGGGGTLSQQLAKNLLPRKEYRFLSLVINKMREIVIAGRLERAYSKEEILTLYLNTVPFPENVFGIDVAARRFFNKAPSLLNVAEGATLIGVLRATTYYNPVRFPERALTRRNIVLQQMEKAGYLDPSRLAALQTLPLNLNYNPVVRNEGMAPYFREFVRQELERLIKNYRKPNGDPYNIYTDGLKVYTTLHTGMQRLAEQAVEEHLSDMQEKFDRHWKGFTQPWSDVNTIRLGVVNSQRYKSLKARGAGEAEIDRIFNQKVRMKIFSYEGVKEVEMTPLDSVRYHLGLLQVGFMAMEPNTGYVRAWVGGINYDFFQFDHVRARRQSGSVFKPVVYMQALRDSIPPCDQIPNRLIVYHEYAKGDWAIKDWRRDDPEPHFEPDGTDKDDWIPQNADGIYGGSYSLEGALTNSINTVTVALIMRMGVKKVAELAKALGIESEVPVEPSIALGTAEVSLYEMIQPFAVFASGGGRTRPLAIRRIENHKGEVIAEFDQGTRQQAVSQSEAHTMTRMLQSVASYGTASRLRWMYNVVDVPVAGKTGTSQNHADGWFIGYTPKLLAGAWVGGDSPLVRFRNFEYGQGAATALPVYARFMRKVLDDSTMMRWHGGEFPVLPPEQLRRLACPARIPSAEELLADSLAKDSLLLLEPLAPVIENQGN